MLLLLLFQDGITFAAWYKEVLDKAATITKYVEPTVIKIEEDYCDDCDDDGDDDYSNDIIINVSSTKSVTLCVAACGVNQHQQCVACLPMAYHTMDSSSAHS